jgi:hypothetical protein
MNTPKQIDRRHIGAALSIDEAGKAVGVPGEIGESIRRSDIESYNSGVVSRARRAPDRARIEAENAARLIWFDRRQAERQQQQIDRRAVLGGAALATAAVFVPPAIADTDPAVVAARKTEALEAVWKAAVDRRASEVEEEAIFEQLQAAYHELACTAATGPAGAAAKLRMVLRNCASVHVDEAALASTIADLERMLHA